MFENIGEKIKSLAIAFCVIGSVGSILGGIISIGYYTVGGIIILLVGTLTSLILSMLTYGFGELIERAVSIDEKMNGTKTNAIEEPSSKNQNETKPTNPVWQCEICGAITNADVCPQCGKPMDK